jgi:hypothetical protein
MMKPEREVATLDGNDDAGVRAEVRRLLRLLVQEAKRQECVEEACRFPGVFAAFALLDPVIAAAVEQEQVTCDDLVVWVAVLLSQA